MKVFSVRFEDAQVEALEAISRRDGKTLSDIIREFVIYCLKAAPQPTPPPPPPPGNPGQGTAAGLPEALTNCVAQLYRDLAQLGNALLVSALGYWALKALAFAIATAAFLRGNPGEESYALGAIMLFSVIDGFWTGRDTRREILWRGMQDLRDLIDAVPGLWAEACKTQSPEAAEAAVLAAIADRRRRLGQLAVKDLGLKSWNPG